MKNLLFFLSLATVFGCNNSNEIENKHTTLVDNPSFTEKDACESVSEANLVSILGWDASSISKSNTNLNENISVCNFISSDEKLLVRIAKKTKTAQNNKVLEKQYSGYLKNGESSISYQEISNIKGNQVLFGKGDLRGGQKVYMLRKRFENAIEFQLEISTESNIATDYLKKLEALSALVAGH